MTKYKTIKECLDAGMSWTKCMNTTLEDGKVKVTILKACPVPMKEEIKRRAFTQDAVEIHAEREDPEQAED